MEIIISILFVCSVIIASIVIDDVSYIRFLKRRRQILTQGKRVVFYHCINREFSDWEKIAEGTIVDCKENYFKLEYSDGSTTYEKYANFGQYDDKVEVYDGDKIILTTGMEANR